MNTPVGCSLFLEHPRGVFTFCGVFTLCWARRRRREGEKARSRIVLRIYWWSIWWSGNFIRARKEKRKGDYGRSSGSTLAQATRPLPSSRLIRSAATSSPLQTHSKFCLGAPKECYRATTSLMHSSDDRFTRFYLKFFVLGDFCTAFLRHWPALGTAVPAIRWHWLELGTAVPACRLALARCGAGYKCNTAVPRLALSATWGVGWGGGLRGGRRGRIG